MTSLSADDVKQYAFSLGFDACGIAAATPIEPADLFWEWTRRGFHGGMTWFSNTLPIRLDISKKLPGAQSVIVVARSYFTTCALPRDAGILRIARYAWGEDYHLVMKKPLQQLAEFVKKGVPGSQTYLSIDTGPVLEKVWAVRAGIGWLGKNSLVLSQRLGSWFFLGIIATTAYLAADLPVENLCGSCDACIRACPTGALVQPCVVNAQRCISYQTIENRGDISPDVAAHIGNWVFGCDRCQEVCPWNQTPMKTTESRFRPRHSSCAFPSIKYLLSMSEEDFLSEFSLSVLKRAGWEKIRRTVETIRHCQLQRDENTSPTPFEEEAEKGQTSESPR